MPDTQVQGVWLWLWDQTDESWHHVFLTGYPHPSPPSEEPDHKPPTSSRTTAASQAEAVEALGTVEGAIRGRRGLEAPPAAPVQSRRRRRKKTVVAPEAQAIEFK